MSRHAYPLTMLVSLSGVFACERSSSDLSTPAIETVQVFAPAASAGSPGPSASSGATSRVSPTGVNGNWIGRWRAGLTAYTEIAGRAFEGPIHGRDIQLDIREDGRLQFWVQEYSHNAPGDMSSCTIEARIHAEGSALILREETSTCSGKHLLPRDHTARIYLVSPCILKIETKPGLSGMNDFAVIRVGCVKSEKAHPSPGL